MYAVSAMTVTVCKLENSVLYQLTLAESLITSHFKMYVYIHSFFYMQMHLYIYICTTADIEVYSVLSGCHLSSTPHIIIKQCNYVYMFTFTHLLNYIFTHMFICIHCRALELIYYLVC